MEYITNNMLSCLDDLQNDLENLEPVKSPKKKMKISKIVPRKRKIIEESSESGKSQSSFIIFLRLIVFFLFRTFIFVKIHVLI